MAANQKESYKTNQNLLQEFYQTTEEAANNYYHKRICRTEVLCFGPFYFT